MKKNILSFTMLLLLILPLGLIFQSCEDEDDNTTSVPEVHYVRITAPEKADSLVTHAFMGSTITLMGEGMEDVIEVWFNDQAAKLNTSFITATSIIVTIPNIIPGTVTNKITLVTKNQSVTYDFGVDVPAPFVSSLLCEYVPTGETAVIKGNYFIDDPNTPLQVFFPGNIEGEVLNVTINEVEVKVPDGVGVGPIVVKSIYGSSRSTFYFRDDRNIILNFDNLTAAGGWRAGVHGNSEPDGLSGNYVRFKGDMVGANGTTWNEDGFSFNLWSSSNGRPNVPFYEGDLSAAAIKFECYVVNPWSAGALQMIFTPYSTSGTNSYIGNSTIPRGLWLPWKESGTYKTEGWTTVTIPLSNFKYTPTGGACANALTNEMLGGLTFFIWNGGVDGTDCNIHVCIDNIRVVPL